MSSNGSLTLFERVSLTVAVLVFFGGALYAYNTTAAGPRERALTRITCYAGAELVIQSVAIRYSASYGRTHWEEYITGTPMMTSLPCLVEPYEENAVEDSR